MAMSVLHLIRWVVFAAGIALAVPVFYLYLISLSALLTEYRQRHVHTRQMEASAATHVRYALLVPAHNEEVILATLLDNLATLTYPKDLYTVYVVADNCTDTTASLARTFSGTRVYERFDDEKRGKGYALNWLLKQLEDAQEVYDAYIILDADSIVEPNFLLVMERELHQGWQALQARYTVLNAHASPSTALRLIALTLVNHVRPLGRNGLGGSSNLSGNGMCFSYSLLKRFPWEAFGLAEDYQYYLMLVEHGERIHYVPDAIVRAQMPTTFAQMRTQDIRWETSQGSDSAQRIAWRLIAAGIKKHDRVRIEAAAELLTPPLSALVSFCLLIALLSLIFYSLAGFLLSMLLISGLGLYIGTALYLLRPARTVYLALLYAPAFMLWKLWVLLVLKNSKKHTSQWIRTSRVPLS